MKYDPTIRTSSSIVRMWIKEISYTMVDIETSLSDDNATKGIDRWLWGQLVYMDSIYQHVPLPFILSILRLSYGKWREHTLWRDLRDNSIALHLSYFADELTVLNSFAGLYEDRPELVSRFTELKLISSLQHYKPLEWG